MNDELHDAFIRELSKVGLTIDITKVDETELKMIINDFKIYKMRQVICTFIMNVFGNKSNQHLWREGLMAKECLDNFEYSSTENPRIGDFFMTGFTRINTIHHLGCLIMSVDSVDEKSIARCKNIVQTICSLHIKSFSKLGKVIPGILDTCIEKVSEQESKYSSNIK